MPDTSIDNLIVDAVTVGVLFDLTNKPRETLVKLQAAFLAGSKNGETILELVDRVQQIITVSRDEAISVASNTIGFILSRSRFDSSISAGMTHKTWFCTSNCPIWGHGAAGEKYKTAIPISEPFIVNGISLMYPRDFMSGHIEECIDCQCMFFASLMPV